MSGLRSRIGRRRRLFTSAFGVAVAIVVAAAGTASSAEDESIRPFKFHASDEALADLRSRIAATMSTWAGSVLTRPARVMCTTRSSIGSRRSSSASRENSGRSSR